MTVAKLLVFASCWTAIVTQATEDLMPEIDDECAAEGCAISALQARAMTLDLDSETFRATEVAKASNPRLLNRA